MVTQSIEVVTPSATDHEAVPAGRQVLCAVESVTQTHVLVSLPDNTVGIIHLKDISDLHAQAVVAATTYEDDDDEGDLSYEKLFELVPSPLDLFKQAQYLVGTFIGHEKSRRAVISLRPSVINAHADFSQLAAGHVVAGQVLSAEDYGYSIGLLGPNGERDTDVSWALTDFRQATTPPPAFLPNTQVPEGTTYVKGQPVLLSVSKVTDAALTLSAKVFNAVTRTEGRSNLSIEGLRAGSLVSAKVTGVDRHDNGYFASFGDGAFKAVISGLHSRYLRLSDIANDRADNRLTEGDSYKARVLSVDPSTKEIRLSVLPHLVQLRGAHFEEASMRVGSVLERVEVKDANDKVGITAIWRDSAGRAYDVFVPVHCASDAKKPKIAENQTRGHVLPKARIVSIHPLDARVICSVQPSVLEASIVGYEDLKVGSIVRGTVEGIKENVGVLVRLSPSVVGLIPPAHLSDSMAPGNEPRLAKKAQRLMTTTFRVGSKVDCLVYEYEPALYRVILSRKLALVKSPYKAWTSISDVTVGSKSHGVVLRRFDGQTVQKVGFPNGFTVIARGRGLPVLQTGSPILCEALKVDTDRNVVIVKLLDAEGKPLASAGASETSAPSDAPYDEVLKPLVVPASDLPFNVERGAVTVFRPVTVSRDSMWLHGTLPRAGDMKVKIHITDVTSFPVAKPFALIPTGKDARLLPCVITETRGTEAIASMRAELLGEYASALPAAIGAVAAEEGVVMPTAPRPSTHMDLILGERYTGYVKSVSTAGVFVTLAANVDVRVTFRDFADEFCTGDAIKARMPVGRVVSLRITSVETGRASGTLRRSIVGSALPPVFPSKLKAGDIVTGKVRNITNSGVFVTLDRTCPAFHALCRKGAAVDISDKAELDKVDLSKYFAINDPVVCRVLNVHPKTGRIDIGVKPTLFSEAELKTAEGTIDQGVDEVYCMLSDADESSSDESESSAAEPDAAEAGSESESEYEYESEYETETEEEVGAAEADAAGVDELDWDEPEAGTARAPAAVPTEEAVVGKRANRMTHDAASDLRADAVERRERELMSGEAGPSSEADFERLILADPTSSIVWFSYVQFLVDSTEIEKARAVCQRALEAIPLTSEHRDDRLNIFIVRLNLEHRLGSAASFSAVLDDAKTHFSPDVFYPRVAEALLQADKSTETAAVDEGSLRHEGAKAAAECLRAALQKKNSKARAHPVVWTTYMRCLFAFDADEARKVYNRAVSAFKGERNHSIFVARTFGRYEFIHGDVERGREVFDRLLSKYSKRTDIWGEYFDLEIRNGDFSRVRQLFERVLASEYPWKTMEFFFKRYEQFEDTHGDEETVANVRSKAAEYIASFQ